MCVCVCVYLQLPYFMNELTLTELDMGSCLPQVNRTSRPVVNQRGNNYTHTHTYTLIHIHLCHTL